MHVLDAYAKYTHKKIMPEINKGLSYIFNLFLNLFKIHFLQEQSNTPKI